MAAGALRPLAGVAAAVVVVAGVRRRQASGIPVLRKVVRLAHVVVAVDVVGQAEPILTANSRVAPRPSLNCCARPEPLRPVGAAVAGIRLPAY